MFSNPATTAPTARKAGSERGMEKVEKMRPIAEKYNLSLIEFA